MSRIYHDRFLGDVRVPSHAELEARKNAATLRMIGVDIVGLRCACCGLPLTDLSKIKVSSEGAIGPECGKPGHVYPCRHAKRDA